MTIYEVYQPSHHGPDRVTSGTTISCHRTPDAAFRKIAASTARLRRQPGMAQSWYDYDIRAVEDGTRRYLTEEEATRCDAR